jgi:uncharacterized membrane protein (UPF0136 family)
MTNFGQMALLVYAVLMLLGGIIGYANAKSLISLLAGAGSAVVLGVAYILSKSQPKAGLGLGALVAVGLVFSFWSRYQKTGNFMPAGMLGIVSVIAAIVFIMAVVSQKQ